MHRNLQRAQILLEQSRPAQAAHELRLVLLDNPNDSVAHAMLAICQADTADYEEATTESQTAIHLAPDDGLSHYSHAYVLARRNRFKEAEQSIREALALDPYHAGYWGKLAAILYAQRRWQDSVDAAEHGLAIDPEHVECANLRGMGQVKLGKSRDAGATIDAILAKQPENALTHCNQGWLLLERNDPKGAIQHFREALRLDPDLDYARHGAIEALKAHNAIYRYMLSYFLWMAKLSGKAQWAVIIGLYVVFQVVTAISKRNPEMAPFVLPIIILYGIFVVLTWTAVPLFNLALRLHPFGKLALSREERIASNWVGACLMAALLSLVAAAVTGRSDLLLLAAVCGLLTLSVAGTFQCSKGWPRRTMAIYTTGLAITGLVGAGSIVANGGFENPEPRIAAASLGLFFLGTFFFGIVANVLAGVLPKR